MKRFGTNAMIFLVAILLSVVLFYFTENPSFFSASILGLKDEQTMKANLWDIGYKNDNNILDVFISDDVKNIDTLSLTVFYDTQDVNFKFENINSQVDYKIIHNEDGLLNLEFYNFSSDYKYKESLFELPFNSTQASVILSQGNLVLSNGNNKDLSIGLLNIPSDDYH